LIDPAIAFAEVLSRVVASDGFEEDMQEQVSLSEGTFPASLPLRWAASDTCHEVIAYVLSEVTADERRELIRNPDELALRCVVPDGFTGYVSQHYRELLGAIVTEALLARLPAINAA
jgi:hypothetical protein